MAVPSKSQPSPNGVPRLRNFYASQIGGQKVEPLTYTGSPLQLLRADLRSAWKYSWFLPFIVIPFTPWPSQELDELCWRSYKNVWAMTLHVILIFAQLGFGVWLAVGIAVWLPIWAYVGGILGFWAFNEAFCVLINGWKTDFQSKVAISAADLEKHKHEKWVFMNGVAVGHHWMQSNLDRIAMTFRRPVQGVHNKTSGIIFDCIECLIQRNFGYAANDIRSGYKIIKNTLYDPKYTKVVFILHSQGGIEGGMILDWLLQEVPQDLMSKLEVYTFGCAANHFNNPHARQEAQHNAVRGKIERTRMANGKAIRYIEHYANSEDFVSRWGVLNYVCNVPKAATAPRYMGRVFERSGKGHQLNQHYLDNMFPYDFVAGRAADHCEFMDLAVEVGGNHDLTCDVREGIAQSLEGTDDRREVILRESDEEGKIELEVKDKRRNSEGKTLRVKDLSRLWLYRNGESPPPDTIDDGRFGVKRNGISSK